MAHNDSHVDQLYADGFQVGFSQIPMYIAEVLRFGPAREEKLEDQDQKMAWNVKIVLPAIKVKDPLKIDTKNTWTKFLSGDKKKQF